MNHDSGRLVDDDDVVVDVHDIDSHRRIRVRRLVDGQRCRIDRHGLADLQSHLSRRRRQSVDHHTGVGDHGAGIGTTHFQNQRHDAVESREQFSLRSATRERRLRDSNHLLALGLTGECVYAQPARVDCVFDVMH